MNREQPHEPTGNKESLSVPTRAIVLTARESHWVQTVKQSRAYIKQMTDHALAHEQDSADARAVWVWLIVLNTLAYDVIGAVLDLLALRELRAGKILCRSLIDYSTRLEYYTRNPHRARSDFEEETQKHLRKFLKPMTTIDNSTNPLWPYVDAFISGDSSTLNLATRNMMEENLKASDPARKEQLLNYFYGREYAISSALSHGNPGAFFDVFSGTEARAANHEWISRGVHVATLTMDLARDTVNYVRAIAIATGHRDEYLRFKELMDNPPEG